MKHELIVFAKYITYVLIFWGVGWLLTRNYEDAKDLAIGSIAYYALYRSIWLSSKSNG